MKVSNIKWKLKHQISTIIVCRSYVHGFSVSKDMNFIFDKDKRRKEVVVGKVAAHLCLTLIIKELKISVEHDRAITTLTIIFSVVMSCTIT
jgi:hypothetical protein